MLELPEPDSYEEDIRQEELDKARAKPRMGIVPGAERARITIEEGAHAEYWLKSRDKIGWAWASFILYVIGIGCLLVILYLQSREVGRAAGWWGQTQQAESEQSSNGGPDLAGPQQG